MDHLFFTNAFFEEELSQPRDSLEQYCCAHPLYIQLQFLSCLFATSQDTVLVSHLPEPDYLSRLQRLGFEIPKIADLKSRIERPSVLYSWGPSYALQSWIQDQPILYEIPDWDIVKEVNSKAFSHLHTPSLPGSALLEDELSARKWWQEMQGPKVLKSIYGVSGRGHHLSQERPFEEALLFLQKEWDLHHPVLAEPWVDRLLDFSTQWMIAKDKTISYLGLTICENNPRGTYLRTHVGPEKQIWNYPDFYLKDHLAVAKEMTSMLASLGYFGHVGYDAMLYKSGQDIQLHPIVEINARKTMGWIALACARHYPSSRLTLDFTKHEPEYNLLPNFVWDRHQKPIIYKKTLTIQVTSC